MEGIQYLEEGYRIRRGEILGYTHTHIDRPETPTNVGIYAPGIEYEPGDKAVCHPDQELMLIGWDGQVNLIRP